MSTEIIIGVHSVTSALQNPNRDHLHLICTDEGTSKIRSKVKEFDSLLKKMEFTQVSPHVFQEKAKELYDGLEFQYSRVPGGVLLLSNPLQETTIQEFYHDISKGSGHKKILMLDQITDVNNMAAIIRTANFYGIDYVLDGSRRGTLPPAFYRISSGAREDLKIIFSSKLTKMVSKLQEFEIPVVALSEHAKEDFEKAKIISEEKKIALIIGNEEKGISHAVLRSVQLTLSIQSQGTINSLNASVAGAIAMEKCFGI
jgi:23S rRNA (guanosine2251-2'-O)-methyltransferase